jgi:hypothetical protein
MFASMLQSLLPQGMDIETIIAQGQAAIAQLGKRLHSIEVAQESILVQQKRIIDQNNELLSVKNERVISNDNDNDNGNRTEQSIPRIGGGDCGGGNHYISGSDSAN